MVGYELRQSNQIATYLILHKMICKTLVERKITFVKQKFNIPKHTKSLVTKAF